MENSESIFKWLKLNYIVRKYSLFLILLGIVELIVFYNLQITAFMVFIVGLVNIAICIYFFLKLSNDNIQIYLGLCVFDFNLFVIWVIQNSIHFSVERIAIMVISIIGFYYFICKFFYEQEKLFESSKEKISLNEVQEIKLFPEQVEDMNRIMSYMDKNENSIIGINGAWGTGKTTLMKKIQMEYKNKNAVFINIDLMAMNIDDIFRYLLQELEQCLIKEGIISFDGPILQQYLSNNIYSNLFWKLILKKRDEYSIVFSKFKNALNFCKKNVFIVFDDIDRIDNNDNLKKIFNVSEKLSGKNIKIIYLYNQQRLEEKGFTKIYLQKYIPFNVRVSEISFELLMGKLIERYKENNDLAHFENIVKYRSEFDWFISRYLDRIYTFNTNNSIHIYIQEHFTIRAFTRFLEEIELLIKEYRFAIEENYIMLDVLFASSYIKIFCPDFYSKIDISKPLLENFSLQDNTGKNLLNRKELISFEDSYLLKKYNYNILVLQAILAHYVLGLWNYDKVWDSNAENHYKELENDNEFRAQMLYGIKSKNNKKIELTTLQNQFYSTICAGNDFKGRHLYIADKLKDIIENNKVLGQDELKEFSNKFWGTHTAVSSASEEYHKWTNCFISINLAAFRWKERERINIYKRIFEKFMREHGHGYLRMSIIKDLRFLIAGLRDYNLRDVSIFVFDYLFRLKVDQNLISNNSFIDFQCEVFKLIIELGYVNQNSFNINEVNKIFANKNDEDYKSFYNAQAPVFINKIIKNLVNNREKLLTSELRELFQDAIRQINIILLFVAKINQVRQYKGKSFYEPEGPVINVNVDTSDWPRNYDLDKLTEEQFTQLVRNKDKDFKIQQMVEYIKKNK